MLKTEMRNPHTTHIDRMTTAEMMAVMQQENRNAVEAVGAATDAIARAVAAVTDRMKQGGRLFYVGCGTSGRLGVLDAAECPPTYGIPHGVVIGIIAGGDGALRTAAEGAEDSGERGRADLLAYAPTALDSVVGISAAGGAAYVLEALRLAREAGAFTAGITSNGDSPLAREAQVAIVTDTGAEVVTGSTRMKAGTAQKLVLNMLSTAVMIRLGHVYENMMINLRPTNVKLRRRMIGIVQEICGVDEVAAERRLEETGWSIRRAVEET